MDGIFNLEAIPDENVLYLKDQGLVFEKKNSVKGWSSDPDLREKSG